MVQPNDGWRKTLLFSAPLSNIAFQVQTRNIIGFLANYLSSSDELALTVSDPDHNELFVEKRDLE